MPASNADRVLGPGPEPGERIVVEAAQLNAIARQFSVAWRSVSSADRAVLEWPGRPLRKDEIIEAVRAADHRGRGMRTTVDIDLPGFTAADRADRRPTTTPTVSQLDYDSNTGRFTAALTVTGGGHEPDQHQDQRPGRGNDGGAGGADAAAAGNRAARR